MKRSELIWWLGQLPWLVGTALVCLAAYVILFLMALGLVTGFVFLL